MSRSISIRSCYTINTMSTQLLGMKLKILILIINEICCYYEQKGVFAASVRRSCGNTRCTFAFKGGSAFSNTCCQTSFCNHTPMKLPSMMIIFSSFIIVLVTIYTSDQLRIYFFCFVLIKICSKMKEIFFLLMYFNLSKKKILFFLLFHFSFTKRIDQLSSS